MAIYEPAFPLFSSALSLPLAQAPRSFNKWDLIKLRGFCKEGHSHSGEVACTSVRVSVYTIQGTEKLNTKKTNNSVKNWGPELDREFARGGKQMAERHSKCSTSIAIREMQS